MNPINKCLFCLSENKHSENCVLFNENNKEQALSKVLATAVQVLYLADNSDYQSALYEIVRTLSPETEIEMLSNERKAFVRVCKNGEDE